MLYNIEFDSSKIHRNYDNIIYFLKQHTDLLRNNDVKKLYSTIPIFNAGVLTQFFIENNIDFLKWIDYIPAYSFFMPVKNIDIPKHINRICREAFYDTCLTEITIPGNVKYLGPSVFSECCELREVNMEEGVEEIAANCFKGCTKLEHVWLPESVYHIEYSAFYDCNKKTVCHVVKDSYAHEWCMSHNIPCVYK